MRTRLCRSVFAISATLGLLTACEPPSIDPIVAEGEEAEDASSEVMAGTVDAAAASTCSTASVKGLALQVIAEANCLSPGAFAAVPSRPNLVAASHVFLYMQAPARDRLVQALDANPSKTMTVNSMLRTLPQQYLLRQWSDDGACGIGLAAPPGASNHETGLAIDVDEPNSWRSSLEARGFDWFGPADVVHFDYVGSGAKNHSSVGIRAFQRLWNRNNPNDKIVDDGDYGPATEQRLRKSPAAGFALGASCEAQACTAAFDDICDSPHRNDIEWLKAAGVVSGCDSDGSSFCPKKPVTRGQLVGMLVAGLNLPGGAPDVFVDDETSPFESAINTAAKKGWISGCSTNPAKFCPSGEVKREVLAHVFAKAFSLSGGSDAFTDDESSPFEVSINALAAAGITSGCGPKKFCPTKIVTREDAAYFLRRVLD
jgi:hypothetical protein